MTKADAHARASSSARVALANFFFCFVDNIFHQFVNALADSRDFIHRLNCLDPDQLNHATVELRMFAFNLRRQAVEDLASSR